MSNLIPIGPHVKLRQGLAINRWSAHLVSDKKDEEFCVPLLRIADMMDGTFSTYISKYAPSNVFAKKGDIVLIAGKGHENYQIVKDNIVEFDDKKVAKMIIDEMK